MKRRVASRQKLQLIRGGAGRESGDPAVGWPGGSEGMAFINARAPSVPSTLDLRLNEYYAAVIILGVLSSATREPNMKWLRTWSFDHGDEMAREAAKRRRTPRRRRA